MDEEYEKRGERVIHTLLDRKDLSDRAKQKILRENARAYKL